MSLEVLINGKWVEIKAESVAFRGSIMTINTKNGSIVVKDYQDRVREKAQS